MIILELIIGEHGRGCHTVVSKVVGALLLLLLGCHEHLLMVVTRRMRSEEGATSKGGQTLGIGLEAKVLSEATIKMTVGGLLVVSVKSLLLNRRVEARTAWQVIPVGRGNVVLLILIIRCHISDKEPLIIKRCRWRF
jgi:hypothetical protein